MVTIHEDIEPWLAAAVHNQLTPVERMAFEHHLADCAECSALHQDELTMNKMITSSFGAAKPDLGFEQRVVSRFREKLPERARLMPLLVSLFRSRATQAFGRGRPPFVLTLNAGGPARNDMRKPHSREWRKSWRNPQAVSEVIHKTAAGYPLGERRRDLVSSTNPNRVESPRPPVFAGKDSSAGAGTLPVRRKSVDSVPTTLANADTR